MSEPASTDAGFRGSLLRHAAAGVGLIVLVAGLFWVIGSVGEEDDLAPSVTDAPEGDDLDDGADDEQAAAGDDEQPAEPDDDAADGSSGDGDVAADDTGEDGTDEDANGDENGEDANGDGDAEDDGEEAEGEDDEPEPRIDPATISVQVLDGYQEDGGEAADAVQAQLEDAGYDIVARNPALRYDVTTVLWTAGFEDEGRQVAAEIDAAAAEQQPGNLSEEVAVHVVVGADRG